MTIKMLLDRYQEMREKNIEYVDVGQVVQDLYEAFMHQKMQRTRKDER